MKEGEDQKRKTYTALCVVSSEVSLSWVKSKLEVIKELQLAQWTPIRVLHRRPDAKRMRTVYYMQVEDIQQQRNGHHLFLLKLATQAGTDFHKYFLPRH